MSLAAYWHLRGGDDAIWFGVCKCVLLLWHLNVTGRVSLNHWTIGGKPYCSIFKCMSVFPKFPTGEGESEVLNAGRMLLRRPVFALVLLVN